MFDPKSGRQTEIFPLAEAKGPRGDFDLDVGPIAMRPDRRRFVFLATYDYRKAGEATPPQVQTVVRCDSMERVWSCKERAVGASEDPQALLREEMQGAQ